MYPVLFSVSYAGFWGQHFLSLDDFVPHAAKLGYRHVEIMGKRPHLSPLDYRPDKLAGLRSALSEHGVSVACVAAYNSFTASAEYPELPMTETQIQYIESLACLAKALDCGLVRVFTAYEHPALAVAAAWNRAAAALRECAERCAACGVTLGIQNHHDLAVHSKALTELLLEIGHPNVKLMLDPWSPCLRGEELHETAKTLAPSTIYTTIADYVRLPRYQYDPALINYRRMDADLVKAVPMGAGEIDSKTFLLGLRAGGFNGPVAYEMCSPLRGGGSLENLDKCARQFVAWLTHEGFAAGS